MVRSLSKIQRSNDAMLSRMERKSASVVEREFPWLLKYNTLPNYILTSKTESDYRERYKNGNIAFLRHPSSTGSAMADCLREISRRRHLAMSPVMSSKHRLLWESERDNLNEFRHRLRLHSGRYVFGVCEKLNDSCSYFLILRDPLQQAMSSYEYCKENFDDEMCGGFNANSMTLRDWIVNQGNVLFRQIILRTKTCSEDAHLNNTLPSEFLFSHKGIPCWLKQKIFLDTFSASSVTHAANYIISHLQEWFAVIGLVDELTDSLKMFEKVYKLPFTKCKHFDKRQPLSVTSSDNSANSLHQRDVEFYDDNEMYSLSEDTYVKEALSVDYRIYRAARKLYHLQKQTLSNSIV